MIRGAVTRRRGPRVPSRAEKSASWLILALLPVIAGAVYVKGRAVDPNLFALNPAALGKPGTAVAPVSAVAMRTLPPHLPGPEWDADGKAEHFTPETLYQKIDGRADEYLKGGFVGLDTISYAHGEQFVDVFVYDMGTDSHARARFAAERPPIAAPLGTDGSRAYCVASSCFVVANRHYVQLIGSEATPASERAIRDAARSVIDLVEPHSQ